MTHEFKDNMFVILFACDFGKRGLVLIITSEIELEISRPLCKGFYQKRVWKKATKCTQVA